MDTLDVAQAMAPLIALTAGWDHVKGIGGGR